ncbi:hypothetical protein RvY_05689 [Ramazzottius varieornatus]|uniref:Uncharacterized protein n=1 Tax=Ramazzottius varieornatus TaxID=947166 RepID=A0A1D1UVY2_RAMVA|nr:hypothetical protein RvY_05689 [Ramazzottius varieornatus]
MGYVYDWADANKYESALTIAEISSGKKADRNGVSSNWKTGSFKAKNRLWDLDKSVMPPAEVSNNIPETPVKPEYNAQIWTA